MKKPIPYRMIEARCSMEPKESYQLCYCSYRKEFIEPITGRVATPVVGKVLSWEYIKEDE